MVTQFSLLAAGFKAACALTAMLEHGLVPSRVCSYRVRGESSEVDDKLRDVCKSAGIELMDRDAAGSLFAQDALVFAIGWQYMVRDNPANLVVLHDSLLPRYRGFAPSVTALINGESVHGVTALLAAADVDSGPIVAQRTMSIQYPMTIHQLFQSLGPLYAECIAETCTLSKVDLAGLAPQAAGSATYSIWRDEEDFRIVWSDDARRIARFVDAVGYPYGGACTTIDGRTIRVLRATEIPDVAFEIRHPGKVWNLHADGTADVVCGTGMIRIHEWRGEYGEPMKLNKLRTRLI